MRILYITHTDMKRESSGSGVRPLKMLSAFNSLSDTHVVLICGNPRSVRRPFFDPRANSRRNACLQIKQQLPDFCYIESSTSGAMAAADRHIVAQLSRMGVPVGYFYRDAHAMIMGLKWLSGKSARALLHNVFNLFSVRATDRFLSKYANIVYFPGAGFSELFRFKDKRLLPPAADGYTPALTDSETHTLIYVGGLSELYGASIMLQAMKLVSPQIPDIRLILVCRKTEYEKYRLQIESISCIQAHFADGEQLNALYAQAAAALYPLSANRYTRLSVSVKIYEYLAHGLPIISTRTGAGSDIIEQNGLGVLCDPFPEGLAQAITNFFVNKQMQGQIRRNVKNFVLSGNTWADRAKQIVSELTDNKKDNAEETEQ